MRERGGAPGHNDYRRPYAVCTRNCEKQLCRRHRILCERGCLRKDLHGDAYDDCRNCGQAVDVQQCGGDGGRQSSVHGCDPVSIQPQEHAQSRQASSYSLRLGEASRQLDSRRRHGQHAAGPGSRCVARCRCILAHHREYGR